MVTVGLELQGIDIHAMAELAAAADAAGLTGVWAPELYDRSATIGAAAMIGATERIGVGTSIADRRRAQPADARRRGPGPRRSVARPVRARARQRDPPDDLRLARPGSVGARGPDGGTGHARAPAVADARGTDRPRGPLLPAAVPADRGRGATRASDPDLHRRRQPPDDRDRRARRRRTARPCPVHDRLHRRRRAAGDSPRCAAHGSLAHRRHDRQPRARRGLRRRRAGPA